MSAGACPGANRPDHDIPGTDHLPHRSKQMNEIIQELHDHGPDPRAKPAPEKRFARGKVRLIPPQNEGTECREQTG